MNKVAGLHIAVEKITKEILVSGYGHHYDEIYSLLKCQLNGFDMKSDSAGYEAIMEIWDSACACMFLESLFDRGYTNVNFGSELNVAA